MLQNRDQAQYQCRGTDQDQIVKAVLCEDSLLNFAVCPLPAMELPTAISPPCLLKAAGKWLWITPL